ncbi:response regulator [Wolinella succinogenes]|uniref:response regulator n=1 Tax=Wolinella succinogenes TaxID=844 RepID=UPI00240A6CBC|nr:response regulator [Wolinella succinogenes]
MKKSLTFPLSLLLVEDEKMSQEMLARLLEPRVSRLWIASNGKEALELYQENTPDVVLTDLVMPEMDGMELIERIKGLNPEATVVISTAFYELGFLMRAIELGVFGYLTKPLSFQGLEETLRKCHRRVELLRAHEELEVKNHHLKIAYDQLREAKEQEKELFIYKERYHQSHQEEAFKKQIKLMRSDLSNSYESGIFFNLFYEPLDILSGDAYGSVRLGEGRCLFYAIDAMGKGLSASLASIQSVSFLNYQLRPSKALDEFDFEAYIQAFLSFIRAQLLNNELLSASFVLMEEKGEKIRYALFGMPPLWVMDERGKVRELVSNNPPISPLYQTLKLSACRVRGFCKMMFCSDGIYEGRLIEGGIYGASHLAEDFARSSSLREMIQLYKSRVPRQEDDLTMIYCQKITETLKEEERDEIPSTPEGIERGVEKFYKYLMNFNFTPPEMESLKSAFFEVLINAIEHGHMGISYADKVRLKRQRGYDSFLNKKFQEVEIANKKIMVYYSQVKISRASWLLWCIEDEGEGFEVNEVFKSIRLALGKEYCGRGLLMAKELSDGLYYNQKGNRAYLLKRLK